MKINPSVVDISHYQNVTNWKSVRASGILGVINKVTEGSTFIDKTFALRRQPVQDAGLLYGAYHFLRPGNMANQVNFFLDHVKPNGGLLLALDHEDPRVSLDEAKEFLRLLEKWTGRVPVLYSGFLVKQQLTRRDPELSHVRLWLSHYSANPSWPDTWAAPWLWQFTGDGKGPSPHSVNGINGTGLDINSYAGTAARLVREWAGDPTGMTTESLSKPSETPAAPAVAQPPVTGVPTPSPSAPWYVFMWSLVRKAWDDFTARSRA